MKMTISDIVRKCGGPQAIAAASQRSRKPIKADAVRKWPLYGIHNDHWPTLLKLGPVTVQEIYEANREAERQQPRRRCRSSGAVA